jgi:hypothetical protein
VRFELTRPFGLPVFKTGAINRSATPPEKNAVCEECAIAAKLSKPQTTVAALYERQSFRSVVIVCRYAESARQSDMFM